MRSSGSFLKIFTPGGGSAILAGLLACQVLSTITVYLSNLHLQSKITAIHDAGYLAVPNLATVPKLTSFAAAFWGGLFFTLTAGAALSLLAFVSAVIYRQHGRIALALLLLIWFGLLYLVNADGLTPLASLFFLIVPPVVFFLALKKDRQERSGRSKLLPLIPILPVFVLALFWFARMDARLFENIRDYLLLTQPAGRAVNDFYYRYTLYPAEVFKPISHKTLRTCYLESLQQASLRQQLAESLRRHDYLPVDDRGAADLIIEEVNGQLALHSDRRLELTTDVKLFVTGAQRLLEEYSRLADRFSFFRVFTFYGILIGFPILLYLGFYGLLRLVLGLFLSPVKASVFAAICCLVAGMAAWVPIYQAGRADISGENLRNAFGSKSWQEHVAALRYVEQHNLEIRDFPAYQTMMQSAHIQVRYWLARAMAVSRDSASIDDLLHLLNDSHPNVVCQALYALGRRADRTVIPKVMQTIKSSNSWYIQRYGYNTVRRLGWQQRAST